MKLKNPILRISLILMLTIAANCFVYTQTSASKVVSKTETISFLIEQNKSANELIEKQNARIKDLEQEVAAEKENSASLGKSYDAAKNEIDLLKRSNAALERAVTINEQTIELLKSDNLKQREKAKEATKDKYIAYIVAAGVIALKFIF